MALTKEELADIDKLLIRIGKNAVKWKFNFGVRLFFGTVFGALSLWLGVMSHEFDKDALLSGMDSSPSITVPTSMPASSPKSTAIPLDTFDRLTIQSKITYTRLSANAHTLMMIFSLVAGFLIGASVYFLFKEKRDLLLVKLAQSYLETQRKGASLGPVGEEGTGNKDVEK